MRIGILTIRVSAIALFLALLPIGISGQTVEKGKGTLEPRTRFEIYTDSFFQEKLYIQHDKDSYLSGETMWFKVYRVDGMKHMSYYYSGVIYVELRDPEHQLVRRMQIIRTDSCFQASYTLPKGLASGYYELIAYTGWMQNYDTDFYYKDRIYIFNASDNLVNTGVRYSPDPQKGIVGVEMTITNHEGEPYRGVLVNIQTYSKGSKKDRITRMIDRNGKLSFALGDNPGITAFEVSFLGQLPVDYKRYFKIPLLDDATDLQFMPEGGHLLAGVSQRVAFKAVGADGKSVDVSGEILDQYDNVVASFSSTHLGMGQFTMQAEAGRKYRAVATDAGGNVTTQALADVAQKGIAISADQWGGMLTCRVLGTDDYDYAGLNLVVHSRGEVMEWVPLEFSNTLQVAMAAMPEGVAHCFVVDDAGKVYSERLLFVNHDKHGIEVRNMLPRYGKRQKVDLTIDLAQNGIPPLDADLSVSVVDANRTICDGDNNIVSSLLLASDIKGGVENASYYFDKSIPASVRARNADLLMMTQGWKRFDIGAIFSNVLPVLDHGVELSQTVSGRITRRWGGNTETGRLSLIGTKDGKIVVLEDIDADEKGHFSFDLTYPDKTIFLIQGTQKETSKNVDITIDTMHFKTIPYVERDNIVQRDIPADSPDMAVDGSAKAPESPEEFYRRSGPKYYYVNGEKILAMQEVVVTASRDNDWMKQQLEKEATFHTTPDLMMEERFYTVRDWLLAQPGITIRYDDNQVRAEDAASMRYGKDNKLPSNIRVVSDADWENESIFYNGKWVRIVDNTRERNGGYTVKSHDIFDMPLSAFKNIWISANATRMNVRDMSQTYDMDESYIDPGDDILNVFGMNHVLTVETLHSTGVVAVRPNKAWIFEFGQMGYVVPDKFYVPKYDGRRQGVVGTDERVTVHWDPDVKVRGGKANVSFYTTDLDTKYRIVLEGLVVRGPDKRATPLYQEINFVSTGYKEQ